MVTCQSANQLKTPAKISWAFKMVSQFGSLGYTIMAKTANLTVFKKTIIDTLHKEGKPQTFIAKEAGCSQWAVSKHVNRKLNGRKKCGRKSCTTNRESRSLMRIVKQNWLKGVWTSIWVNFTRKGLRLGSRHQESPHTDVSRNLATVVIRVVLPGLRRRRTGLLPICTKSSFRMRASFVFHLEIKVLEFGGRVEKLIVQVRNQIKSNHFYCHIATAHVPWWVKFLRACSRQCRNNLHIDSTYLQTYTENNVQNTQTYTHSAHNTQ